MWALCYQVGPGGGYFAQVVEVAPGDLRPLAIVVGNTTRYLAEFLSSLLLFSAVESVGVVPIVCGYATSALACAALFASFLPEVNPQFRASDSRSTLL